VSATGHTRRRRRIIGATALAGSGLLGASLSTEPGSARFYGLGLASAGTWTVGGLASRRARRRRTDEEARVPAIGRAALPMLLGAGAFGVFYAGALIARRLPILEHAITDVFRYDHRGASRLVLCTALVNGVGEELFFRGALYDELHPDHAVLASTAGYALVTTVTRNPALVLASVLMGTLFAEQRRCSGGVVAPVITHLTWSTLMLRYLPPLFRPPLVIAT
jgi:membrane protease YdiL (CAAX protease family)